MTLKIGITGGIGSGKTVVCKIFKILGIPVFEADRVARELWDSNLFLKEKLITFFGEKIYTENGYLDRSKLASIIFNDDSSREKVNELIHPIVKEKFIEWFDNQDTKYVLHEAAILFESGFYKMMDYNILISAETELRIKRVLGRDSLTRALVLQRIAKQWDDEVKSKMADTVIFNNNELLIPQVLEIDRKIKVYGKIW